MMGMMGIGMLLPVLAVIAVIYGFARRPEGNDTAPTRSAESALDILSARYARGEITQTEYFDIRRQILDG